MSEIKAIITDIARASLHDGYGFRTTVFFKGCPLNCFWCHNPECIAFEPQVLTYPEKCIGCGKCSDGCYSGARVVCGREMTVAEIMAEIRKDIPYYGENGGVTFSGGEALAQPAALNSLADLCKEENIGTAVETSLYIYNEEIYRKMDFIMADLKIWDGEAHLKYVGVDNEIIKENFKKLDKLGVPFIVRTPLIPNITDNRENIESIRNFIKDFKNLIDYELLPYNPLVDAKLIALGRQPLKLNNNLNMKEVMKYADLGR